MANIEELLIGLGIDADEYAAGIDKTLSHTDRLVNGITNTVGPAITAAFAGGALAVGAFAATSVNAAGDFEAGMLSFASVTGAAIKDAGFELEDFQGLFLKLGAETSFSAAQAQQAAIELAKGGVAIPSIMEDATQATLDLASAGGLDLAVSAGIVAKQLGVWASTGVTATEVSNLLAQAANASTVDVDELAAGLANAQGTAKTVGVEYQDLIQTMALLAPNFASASTAGTSLNNFLVRLQPTTKSASSAMRDLGLITKNGSNVFFDAQGNFLGMGNAAEKLRIATAGLSEAQRTQMLQTIFGNDAMGAAVALAASGQAGFEQMGQAMIGAGTAADQAGLKNQGFKFAVDSLLGSIETLQIIIGSAALPVLTAFVNDAIIPAVNAIAEFSTRITTASDPIYEIVSAISEFSPLLGDLVGYILVVAVEGDKMNDFFANLPAPVQAAIGVVEGFVGLLGDNLTPVLIGIGTVITTVVLVAIGSMIASFLTIAAPIAAAIAVVAALYAAYEQNFFGIRDLVDSVINGISALISSVMSVILAFWRENGTQIQASATEIWNMIYSIVSTQIELMRVIITTVFNAVAGFIDKHGDDIVDYLTTAWELIEGVVKGTLKIIQGIMNTVLAAIKGDWKGAWKGIQDILSGAFELLETIWTKGLDLLKGAFNIAIEAVRDILKKFIPDATGLGGDIIDGVIDGVKGAVNGLVDAVVGATQAALDAAKKFLGISSPSKVAAEEIGKPFVEGIIGGTEAMLEPLRAVSSGLGEAFKNGAVTSFTNARTDIKNAMGGLISDAKDVGGDLIGGIKNGFEDGIGSLIDAAKRAAKSALGAAKNALGIRSPSSVAAAQIGKPFVEGIIAGTDRMLGALIRTGSDIGSTLSNATRPRVSVAGSVAPGTGTASARAAMGGAAGQLQQGGTTFQWNVEAHYRKYQDERTLRDDIRMESALYTPLGA